MNPRKELERLHRQIAICRLCPLSESRSQAVPGEGPIGAAVMLIGEGPGEKEDQQGRPFVGRAGAILDDMLEASGLERRAVFITSVVKCRPPENRDPKASEIEACRGYLDRQIELVDPACIVTLGRFSMARWFPGSKISRIHGRAERFDSRLVFPTFHPGAVLHQPRFRSLLEEDFHSLGQILSEPRADPQGSGETGETSDLTASPRD
jgi:DNA polymerase